MKFYNYTISYTRTIYIVILTAMLATAFKTNSGGKPVRALALDKMNILYTDLPNPLTVAVESVSDEKIFLTGSRSLKITKDGPGHFKVQPDGTEPFTSLSICKLNGTDTVILNTGTFRVRRLPDPVAMLGNLHNDGLPKYKPTIVSQTKLNASMGTCFQYDLSYHIVSYRFAYSPGEMTDVHVVGDFVGDSIPATVRNIIRDLPIGSTLYFEQITAQADFPGSTRRVGPVVIRLR